MNTTCKDKSCKCHRERGTVPVHSTSICDCAEKGFNPKIGHTCGIIPSTSTKEWERTFDEQVQDAPHIKIALKQFITQLLDQARKEERKEVARILQDQLNIDFSDEVAGWLSIHIHKIFPAQSPNT